jgi:sulfite reductase (NADPH) hemoprotein beta-component
MADPSNSKKPLTEVEHIKRESRYLRGTLTESLRDPLTGGLASSDTHLVKMHGIYQQDHRDLREERQRQKLEPLYSFMARIRLPGGVCTPAQYLALDGIARKYGNGTLRLTTRQTFQVHGVLKRNLAAAVKDMHQVLLDSIAACGDVNRNVMCNPNPYLSALHAEAYAWSKRLSEHLLPRTRAYHEIFLGEERVAGGDTAADVEPMYGPTYLPRKFKIALAIPPENDVDVYANDLGFVAIAENGNLAGFDVLVGGGMGTTHGDKKTYPRLADVIGFCTPEELLPVAEAVLTVQRDFGDRTNRKHARLKYTIDDRGLPWFVAQVNARLARPLAPARPFQMEGRGDRYGWVEGTDRRWHRTLFVLSGRIHDEEGRTLMSALRTIAHVHDGDFRVTANQNLMIANVGKDARDRVDEILRRHGVGETERASGLRLNALSCVALPTCPLAMAESERYLPALLARLEGVTRDAGLEDEPITLRMTGCPNGCARPFLAEIGLVGKNLGRYNLYLGASPRGDRLNQLVAENLDEAAILATLTPLIQRFARERHAGERFGDFVVRAGILASRTEA